MQCWERPQCYQNRIDLIMYFFPYVLKRLKNQTFIISDDVTNSVQYIMLAHVHVPENGLPWDENPQNG